MRESEGASESSPQHTHATTHGKNPAPSSCWEGTQRGRDWGQRHSMVLSSQEPGQIQTHSTQPNPWRCVSHTHTHIHQLWRATLVLLGCYPNFYPCCSWDYFLTWTTSKTNRQIGWCHITTWPFFFLWSGPCIHTRTPLTLLGMHVFLNTHTHSDPHQQKCECRVPLGDEDR